MRTIGIVAAIAIVFIVITSPQRESATAQQYLYPECQVDDNSQLRELTSAIGELQQSVDDRLSDVETRFTSLEAPAEAFDDARLAALEDRVTELEEKVATYEPKTAAAPVQSGGSSGGGTYLPAPIVTSGMTTSQIAMLRDADHDTFGGSHPPAMRSRSRTTTVMAASDCPGGVCPTSSVTTSRTVQSRGGLLGFGILGRRR